MDDPFLNAKSLSLILATSFSSVKPAFYEKPNEVW